MWAQIFQYQDLVNTDRRKCVFKTYGYLWTGPKFKKLKDKLFMPELILSKWGKWTISKADIVYTQFRSRDSFLEKTFCNTIRVANWPTGRPDFTNLA